MHSPQTDKDPLLRLFLDVLKRRFGEHLQQVILFGSRARGDHIPSSDYDCLAVLDECTPAVDETIDEVVGDFLYDHNVVFSVVPVSADRLRQQPFNPLFMNIAREGVVL